MFSYVFFEFLISRILSYVCVEIRQFPSDCFYQGLLVDSQSILEVTYIIFSMISVYFLIKFRISIFLNLTVIKRFVDNWQ